MSDITSGGVTGTQSTDSGGTAQTAKTEAREVASTAGHEAERVGQTAKEEAASVAREAKGQARDLYHQTKDELREQASRQQERVAGGLRTLADQLGSMADGAPDQGVASDLVRQVSTRAGDVGAWLGDRDPGSLVREVSAFARRKPGVFIGVAALAGLAAGRLTRALAQGAPSDDRIGGVEQGALRPATADTETLGQPVTDRPAGYVPQSIPPVGGGQVPPPGASPVYDRTQAHRDGGPLAAGGDDERRDTF